MMPSTTSLSKLRILFVASGRRVSLIEAFRKYLGPGDRLYGTDITELVPTRTVLDSFLVVPPWDVGAGFFNPNFRRAIEGIVVAKEIDLVIPLMDDAARALRYANFDTPVLGSKTGIDYDKARSNRFFKDLGLMIPEVVCPYDSSKWPIIGRPARGGTGSRGTCVIKNREDFKYYYKHLQMANGMIYSRFIDGPEYTVDCFKDFEGNLLCVVPRKRFEVRNGEVQKGRTVRHPEVIAQATKIAEAFDFTGLMCVQCIENEGNLYWLEINARFGGGTPLSIAAGADSPGWIIQMLRGEKVEPLQEFKEITMVRADREFFFV
jgi:carbamoyl-phosphate synthase large subunit